MARRKKRNFRSKEERIRLVHEMDQLVATGMTKTAAAEQMNIRPSQFIEWRKLIKDSPAMAIHSSPSPARQVIRRPKGKRTAKCAMFVGSPEELAQIASNL